MFKNTSIALIVFIGCLFLVPCLTQGQFKGLDPLLDQQADAEKEPVRLIVKFKPAKSGAPGLGGLLKDRLSADKMRFKRGDIKKSGGSKLDTFFNQHKKISETRPVFTGLVKKMKTSGKTEGLLHQDVFNKVKQQRPTLKNKGSPTDKTPRLSDFYVMKLDAKISKDKTDPAVTDLINELKNDPDVESVTIDEVITLDEVDPAVPLPNDPSLPELWGIDRVNAPEAWAQGITGAGVVVAVVDSGVDYNHPDLSENIWQNPGEIPDNGIDDDANGYIDDVNGYNFTTYNDEGPDNNPMDQHYHGTHVAGNIAAVGDNGIGVVGVAHGSEIMPVRALSSIGKGRSSDIAAAITYAATMGADVINLSLGRVSSYEGSLVEREAIAFARSLDAVVVAAAGNDHSDTYNYYPANIAGVVTVAAIQSGDNPRISQILGSTLMWQPPVLMSYQPSQVVPMR
ncbi:MAG: S8 family serine peptidase [Deltaproteobacteria bacterium]|nr:S8 family serine peptidase [Deltaproteobacteria bacterium]